MERGGIEATVRTAFDELVQARGAHTSNWLDAISLADDHRGGGAQRSEPVMPGRGNPSNAAIVNIDVHVDRDRSSKEQAHGFARELETTVRGRLADKHEVVVHITPTTRIEYVFALVADHVESYDAQRAEETLRSGERWVWCATPERIVGWTHGQDRIRLEMVAESSADERAAAELGERFLDDLKLEPELRALIDVVGTSH